DFRATVRRRAQTNNMRRVADRAVIGVARFVIESDVNGHGLSEIRNPKSEARKKAEIRRPNRRFATTRRRISTFGLRISGFTTLLLLLFLLNEMGLVGGGKG